MLDDAQVLPRVLEFDSEALRVVFASPKTVKSGKVNLTNTSASDVIAAPAAGKQTVVVGVLVTNKDTIVSTNVEIRDGTTVKILNYARKEGGFSYNAGGMPLFPPTANAITARCVTDSADVDVTISAYEKDA